MSPDASTRLALRLARLSKRYPAGDRALSDVSLSVPPGQVLGLIGPSGAGKSTLIRCINRLVEPTSGQVFLGPARPGSPAPDEIELTGLGRRGLRRARRRIGMIFQEFALVERLTVMENVLSGRLGYVPFWRSWLRRFPAADIANAYRLLDRVGLAEHADKRADALSGGQRQRVGIARALAQEPDLLLVDEPTASLDPKTSRQIMRLLREVCAEANRADDTGRGSGPGSGPGSDRGLAAIVNIHDVALAQQFMMRIVGLRAGRIVYDGPPEGLSPEVLTQIYGEEDWGPATEDAGHSGGAPERHPAGATQHHPGPEPPTDQSMAGAL